MKTDGLSKKQIHLHDKCYLYLLIISNIDIRESYDSSGKSTYKEACRLNSVIPVSYFLRHISDTELIMKHHGLGPAGAKAIAISLVVSTMGFLGNHNIVFWTKLPDLWIVC